MTNKKPSTNNTDSVLMALSSLLPTPPEDDLRPKDRPPPSKKKTGGGRGSGGGGDSGKKKKTRRGSATAAAEGASTRSSTNASSSSKVEPYLFGGNGNGDGNGGGYVLRPEIVTKETKKPYDIILGRGANDMDLYQQCLEKWWERYEVATHSQKKALSALCAADMRQSGIRFLSPLEDSDGNKMIGCDEYQVEPVNSLKVIKKVLRALRAVVVEKTHANLTPEEIELRNHKIIQARKQQGGKIVTAPSSSCDLLNRVDWTLMKFHSLHHDDNPTKTTSGSGTTDADTTTTTAKGSGSDNASSPVVRTPKRGKGHKKKQKKKQATTTTTTATTNSMPATPRIVPLPPFERMHSLASTVVHGGGGGQNYSRSPGSLGSNSHLFLSPIPSAVNMDTNDMKWMSSPTLEQAVGVAVSPDTVGPTGNNEIVLDIDDYKGKLIPEPPKFREQISAVSFDFGTIFDEDHIMTHHPTTTTTDHPTADIPPLFTFQHSFSSGPLDLDMSSPTSSLRRDDGHHPSDLELFLPVTSPTPVATSTTVTNSTLNHCQQGINWVSNMAMHGCSGGTTATTTATTTPGYASAFTGYDTTPPSIMGSPLPSPPPSYGAFDTTSTAGATATTTTATTTNAENYGKQSAPTTTVMMAAMPETRLVTYANLSQAAAAQTTPVSPSNTEKTATAGPQGVALGAATTTTAAAAAAANGNSDGGEYGQFTNIEPSPVPATKRLLSSKWGPQGELFYEYYDKSKDTISVESQRTKKLKMDLAEVNVKIDANSKERQFWQNRYDHLWTRIASTENTPTTTTTSKSATGKPQAAAASKSQ